jgi:hypothetical protein
LRSESRNSVLFQCASSPVSPPPRLTFLKVSFLHKMPSASLADQRSCLRTRSAEATKRYSDPSVDCILSGAIVSGGTASFRLYFFESRRCCVAPAYGKFTRTFNSVLRSTFYLAHCCCSELSCECYECADGWRHAESLAFLPSGPCILLLGEPHRRR